MNLYTDEKFAKQFAATRRTYWTGWCQSIDFCREYIPDFSQINILDLGCGNGRFLGFLLSMDIVPLEYIGLDYSKTLLSLAKQEYQNSNYAQFLHSNFLDIDWLSNSLPANEYENKFELIVAFGLTHHLETIESQKLFFKNIERLLSKNGIVIVSFWQFQNQKIWNTRKQVQEKANLYELRFNNTSTRTAYLYSQSEINDLLSRDFTTITNFYADAKDGKGNLYYILKRKIS